jgi:hypothetical protein
METRRKIVMRKITLLLVGGLFVSCAVTFAGAANPAKEAAAVVAAEQWLSLVDQGQYAESWKKAAEYFRNAVAQTQWEQMVQAARQPLGKLISRQVKRKTFTTTLPGAPDGEYVVIEFASWFENKKSAIETVCPMMDKDGKWRVSGYYIR